jgi:fructokinase
MRNWELDERGIRVDSEAPTGLVDVRIADGGHRFEILADRAYDRLEADQLPEGTGAALVVHGTLALRTAGGRAALAAIREATGAPLFCDLNLRAPWVIEEAVAWSLAHATWLKLNDDELAETSGRACPDADACAAAASVLLDAHDIDTVLVTRGEHGALAVHRDGTRHDAGTPAVREFVDSVGAGDAFTAVAILGRLRGWSMAATLERAVAFAARICAQRGATAADPALYADLRREKEGAHG